jgi:predicted ATP-dependent endonuclease of OLD family
MECLEVSNFLTIKKADLVVNRFTILIGPQANGKSVVAKLLYFFRSFLNNHYFRSIKRRETRRQLIASGLGYFEAIFPKYTWTDQNFRLVYSNDETRISITRGPSAKGLVELELSQDLIEAHRKARLLLKRKLKESEEPEREIRAAEVYTSIQHEVMYSATLVNSFHRSVFIPASRSFFANLQKNVFSFLANNIAIDPLIKEFGSAYEFSKTPRNTRFRLSKSADAAQVQALRDDIDQEIESILAGQYVYQDDQDWILSDKRKINLANASSGQQEVLPLLLVLKQYTARASRGITFFIEEPEAHLFPLSQRRLVDVLARLYAELQYSFVLTTHSPYVLTALNNLIMAANLVKDKGDEVLPKVQEIIGKGSPIRFEDVSAYTIRNGNLESILDAENRLIGSTIIDSVSDEFDRVFDKLMQVELG